LRTGNLRGDELTVEIEKRDRADLLADEVRDQQHDHEDMNEQIVETKIA
jgi:hypothetical protein